jgi:hypothetical protein
MNITSNSTRKTAPRVIVKSQYGFNWSSGVTLLIISPSAKQFYNLRRFSINEKQMTRKNPYTQEGGDCGVWALWVARGLSTRFINNSLL